MLTTHQLFAPRRSSTWDTGTPLVAWECPDCGAPAGDGCDDSCPSAIAAEEHALDHADQRHPALVELDEHLERSAA